MIAIVHLTKIKRMVLGRQYQMVLDVYYFVPAFDLDDVIHCVLEEMPVDDYMELRQGLVSSGLLRQVKGQGKLYEITEFGRRVTEKGGWEKYLLHQRKCADEEQDSTPGS
jgi:hypothetical protein